jgi:hypothetical protein
MRRRTEGPAQAAKDTRGRCLYLLDMADPTSRTCGRLTASGAGCPRGEAPATFGLFDLINDGIAASPATAVSVIAAFDHGRWRRLCGSSAQPWTRVITHLSRVGAGRTPIRPGTAHGSRRDKPVMTVRHGGPVRAEGDARSGILIARAWGEPGQVQLRVRLTRVVSQAELPVLITGSVDDACRAFRRWLEDIIGMEPPPTPVLPDHVPDARE